MTRSRPTPGKDFFGDAKGLTQKEFLHRYEIPTTWGILHKGTWYARGAMGWFCATDARAEDSRDWAEGWWRFIQNLRPDTRLTIVDCHV